jgi:hypothetical protein
LLGECPDHSIIISRNDLDTQLLSILFYLKYSGISTTIQRRPHPSSTSDDAGTSDDCKDLRV